MEHRCPKCQSDQIQTFQMAYEAGTAVSVHDSAGVGVGVGANGGLGLGLGGRTTSSSMTALAEKVAPPQPRPIHWLFYLLAVSGFVGLFAKGEVGLKLVGIGMSAIGCFIIFRTKKWNRDEFPRLLAQWERSWVCHRCGHTFTRQD